MVIRVVPSPSRVETRLVRRSARRSSFASCSASCCSPISGATMSRIRRPRIRSSRGPKWAAWATRCASAAASTSTGSLSEGSSSRARVITRACATLRSPSPRAAATTHHRRSRASASARSRRLLPKSPRVSWLISAAMSRAPSARATSSETAISRIRSPASCASTCASPSSAVRLSAGDMNATGTSAASLSALAKLSTHPSTGCTAARSNVELTPAPPAGNNSQHISGVDPARPFERANQTVGADRWHLDGSNLCSILQGNPRTGKSKLRNSWWPATEARPRHLGSPVGPVERPGSPAGMLGRAPPPSSPEDADEPLRRSGIGT